MCNVSVSQNCHKMRTAGAVMMTLEASFFEKMGPWWPFRLLRLVPADTGTAAWYSSNMPCSSSRKAAT